MCQNIHKVRNKYTGQELFVPCGKCEACLQDKADKRAIRISNHYADDGEQCMVMLTLTYDNKYIPYIRKSDVYWSMHVRDINNRHLSQFIDYSDEYDYTFSVPVYRDYDLRWNKSSEIRYAKTPKTLRFERDGNYYVCCECCRSAKGFNPVADLQFSVKECDVDKLPSLVLGYKDKAKKQPIFDNDRVGVAYYPDVQKFFKRLRINLKRNGYNFPISFYATSEYGENFSRPHFHVLLFFDKRYYEQVKRSAYKSWPYDYRLPERCDFRPAVHPASYVATYVNCLSFVPDLFKASKVYPKHSYSFRFGVGKENLSLRQVYESYRRNDFLVYREVIKEGTLSVVPAVLPVYVVNRYAPKFKGYCRLTRNQIYDIAEEPTRLPIYRKRLNYVGDDYARNYTMLKNKRQQWIDAGFTAQQFADFYANCWCMRASKSMILSHSHFDVPKKLFQYYYNILDYYAGSVSNECLDNNMFNLPKDYAYEVDPNLFIDVQESHLRSYQRYHYYKKSKHVNSIAFGDALKNQ